MLSTTSSPGPLTIALPITIGSEPAPLEPLQISIHEAVRLLAFAHTIPRLIVRGELPVVGENRLRLVPLQGLRAYRQRYIIQ